MPDNRQYVCETMDCHRRAERYVTCERGRAFPYCLSCADGLIRILNEKDCGPVSYESLPLAEAVDALLAVYDRGGLTSISRFAPFMENLRHAR